MIGTHTVLNKLNGVELGYHRNVVASLIKRKAVVINGAVYAPVKKRVSNEVK
tara:strand:+ start:490 stop:645 length:156 start_codon:yes stop_codon:yes gene_type:complete